MPSIASFFSNVLGANLRNARWSWGAERQDQNRVFLRVWADDIRTVQGAEAVRILGSSWQGTSPGYGERVRHVNQLRGGAEGYGVLCEAVDPDSRVERRIAAFDDHFLLKFGRILEASDGLYAEITERRAVAELAASRTSASTLIDDLRTLSRWQGEATVKEALTSARIGQGQFRADVLARWDRCCAVTGIETLAAIRASHIKPWKDSKNEEWS